MTPSAGDGPWVYTVLFDRGRSSRNLEPPQARVTTLEYFPSVCATILAPCQSDPVDGTLVDGVLRGSHVR